MGWPSDLKLERVHMHGYTLLDLAESVPGRKQALFRQHLSTDLKKRTHELSPQGRTLGRGSK